MIQFLTARTAVQSGIPAQGTPILAATLAVQPQAAHPSCKNRFNVHAGKF
jgi:hypothetical protein